DRIRLEVAHRHRIEVTAGWVRDKRTTRATYASRFNAGGAPERVLHSLLVRDSYVCGTSVIWVHVNRAPGRTVATVLSPVLISNVLDGSSTLGVNDGALKC